MKHLRVAMIAPPWLPIPPSGYGGIENVIAVLVPALMELGVRVELFTIGETELQADKNHYLYETSQYKYIHRPQYDSLPIRVAHIQNALNIIKKSGKFDIIHDHSPYIGPAMLANLSNDYPPVLHTLHGPPFTTPDRLKQDIPDNRPMWRELNGKHSLFYNGISKAQMRHAPHSMRSQILPVVHNAVDINELPFVFEKQDYFITLARFNRDKGQDIAIAACLRSGAKLKLAGVVGDMTSPRQVMLQLANPTSQYRGLGDFRFFSDKIFPYLDDDQFTYVGSLSGERKLTFISRAKALLFPIQWEEPFGMAPIEALACGTPVVAMARGALPEIIKHGVNGFLAKTRREFYQYVNRVDEIDPEACRASVEEKFSARQIAQAYLERYQMVLEKYRAQ